MSWLTPDLFYTSVSAVELESLADRGIRGLLIDLDNTLLARDSPDLQESAFDFVRRVRSAGMTACLVSNNWHGRVHAAARQLGFGLVPRALKPLPFAFARGCRLLGVDRTEAAVIGDQLFTDILGGNAAGLTTVLVLPLSSADLPHTLLLRRIEARVLRARMPIA